jgi:hypothetical protein
MAAKSPPATAKPTNGMRCGIATNTPTTRVEGETGCAMDVHETSCGLVEMLGFAVDVFGPELPRQDGYARACGGRPWELWKRQVPRQHCCQLQRGPARCRAHPL